MIPDDVTTILEIAKAIIRLIPHTVAAPAMPRHAPDAVRLSVGCTGETLWQV